MSRSQLQNTSAVQRVAAAIREFAAKHPAGTFLGSEEELIARFDASRPTLRQAMALVVQEQLVRTRRGMKGGYFAAFPGSESVSRIAAIYLRSRRARLSEMTTALEPIRTELARLASQQTEPELRLKLRDFLERDSADNCGPSTYAQFLEADRAIGLAMGEAADNPLLSLFLSITYDLLALLQIAEDIYINRPERPAQYKLLRGQMIEAIIDGDEELAVLASRRCSALTAQWINMDLREGATVPLAAGEIDNGLRQG